MNLGNFLRQARQQKGLTQAGLGQAVAVSRESINKLEVGRWMPNYALLMALCNELQLDKFRAKRLLEREHIWKRIQALRVKQLHLYRQLQEVEVEESSSDTNTLQVEQSQCQIASERHLDDIVFQLIQALHNGTLKPESIQAALALDIPLTLPPELQTIEVTEEEQG